MADVRKCIGSAKFGIEAHDAPPEDFPTQPSQKDGLGRMCKQHWRAYTNALRKAALARKAASGGVPLVKPPRQATTATTRRRAKAPHVGARVVTRVLKARRRAKAGFITNATSDVPASVGAFIANADGGLPIESH